MSLPARSDLESARKWLHLAPGILAFGLPFVGFVGALALCGGLLGFNLWILPRFGGTFLWRHALVDERAELADGEAWGILFYPLALLVLAVGTLGRLEVLAGAWGMLALGDAAATLVGRRWGRRALPWHTGKSWVGSLAFFLASWASASFLVPWTAPGRYAVPQVLLAAAVAALVGAVVESLPGLMDDNLSVTLFGGGALFCALEAVASGSFVSAPGAAWGALMILVLALGVHLSGALDWAGTATGSLLALAMLWGGGWRAVVLLAFFVGTGTAAGRLRQRVQPAGDGAATRSEKRGMRNVLANGVVAACCGLLLASQVGDWALLALGGALATATADTVGGELGQTLGGRTRRLSDGREVPPGTNGGVSWAGSVAMVAAAALFGALGLALGLWGSRAALIVAAAGAGGAVTDSLLGATLERRGLLDNEAVNCLSTLTGAWLAAQASLVWP